MKKIAIIVFSALIFFSCSRETESEQAFSRLSSVMQEKSLNDDQSFESSLNEIYTSKQDRPIISKTISFPFTHNNGVITEAEKNRIISNIAKTSYEGRDPFVIDVNYKDNQVEMVFASVGGDNIVHGDVVFGDVHPEDCVSYDERLALATDCGEGGTDYFDGATNLRPDGGIDFNGDVLPGYFCDMTVDPLGGGCGRTMTSFLSNNPLPDNHLYWEDVRVLTLTGREDLMVNNEWDYGLIEVFSPLLWNAIFYTQEEIDAACLNNADLNQYYCNLFELISIYLPDGYFVIDGGGRLTWGFVENGEPILYFWQITFRVGKSVSCCDCCC